MVGRVKSKTNVERCPPYERRVAAAYLLCGRVEVGYHRKIRYRGVRSDIQDGDFDAGPVVLAPLGGRLESCAVNPAREPESKGPPSRMITPALKSEDVSADLIAVRVRGESCEVCKSCYGRRSMRTQPVDRRRTRTSRMDSWKKR